MAYSDRTYVGTEPGPGLEWVTVYCVKLSHCNLCRNLNRSYTLALFQSRSHYYITSVLISHHAVLCKVLFTRNVKRLRLRQISTLSYVVTSDYGHT